VRAQQQALPGAFQVKRVVHRTRGMVRRLIERREVVEVGLDLGAVRTSNRSSETAARCARACVSRDASRRAQGPPGRVTSSASPASRRIELGGAQRLAAGGERGFDLVFRFVETRTGITTLVGRELGELLPRLAQYARLSEVACLAALEIVRVLVPLNSATALETTLSRSII